MWQDRPRVGVDLVTTQRSGPQTAGLPRGGRQELWERGEGAAERRVWEPASHCVAVGLRLAFCPSIRLARVRAARSLPRPVRLEGRGCGCAWG